MSSIPTAPTDPNPNQRPSIPDQVTSSIHKLANLFLGYLKKGEEVTIDQLLDEAGIKFPAGPNPVGNGAANADLIVRNVSPPISDQDSIILRLRKREEARFEAAKAEKGKYGYRQGIENETLEETLYHRINHKIRVRKERWGMKTY
mmetsp:Transcript_25646/g.62858  ORF Transcript_25646/g.62858 Transcript_25646/m.62858 type:complete len:146 (-) Transcript_25646:63-500(-)